MGIKLKRLNPHAPDADQVYFWVNIRIVLPVVSAVTPNSRNNLFFIFFLILSGILFCILNAKLDMLIVTTLDTDYANQKSPARTGIAEKAPHHPEESNR